MDRKEMAQREWEQAMQESIEEEEALVVKLKAEGRLCSGLDGNQEDFAHINAKLKRRMKEIQEKYKDH